MMFLIKKVSVLAGERLSEQFNKGYELGFFILTNGHDYVALPLAQDHKNRRRETGLNTGGRALRTYSLPMNITPLS